MNSLILPNGNSINLDAIEKATDYKKWPQGGSSWDATGQIYQGENKAEEFSILVHWNSKTTESFSGLNAKAIGEALKMTARQAD